MAWIKPIGVVRATDRGMQQILERVAAAKKLGSYVRVGVVGKNAAAEHAPTEGEPEKQPLTNAQLAAIHEFGTETIPERSFLRSATKENAAKYRELWRRGVQLALIEGRMGWPQVLQLVGLQAQSDVRAKITDGPFAPLAPSTIKRKLAKGAWKQAVRKRRKQPPVTEQPRPLIDTGALRNSINFDTHEPK